MPDSRTKRLRFLQRLFFAIAALSLLIPGLYVLRTIMVGSGWNWNESTFLLYNVAFTFTVSAAIFAANIATVRQLDLVMPWKNYVRQRIVLEFLITSFNAAVIMLLWTYLFFQMVEIPYSSFKPSLFENILIALIINLIATTIMESSAFFRQWKASLVEAERLQKERLRTQYEALKTQVNPHFLFNSLNTLSSLVHSNPDVAEEFIDEFARFYRYILEIRDKNLVSLQEELEMMDSYIYLQKIRFGNALSVEKHIDSDFLQHLIPPLTLQVLSENAIKHNALSPEKPLVISLEVNNGFLMVSNNLQQRQEAVKSTGIGLYNLREKYKIFSEAQPEFITQGHQYKASVPLICQQS